MWSFSRPMLSLILISDEHFQKLKSDFIRSQPADRQPAVAECLEKLMVGVQYNLEAKNRDKFTQVSASAFSVKPSVVCISTVLSIALKHNKIQWLW